jgi:hypothetical protein
MSLEFYVWRGPKMTAEEIAQRLWDMDEHGVDEASVFQRSDRLETFRREVLSKYPSLEDLEDDEPDTPWAMTPIESPYFIELNLQWSTSKERLTWIFGRALTNGLYIYDPQGDEVVAPGPARWQVYLRRLGLGRLAGPDP